MMISIEAVTHKKRQHVASLLGFFHSPNKISAPKILDDPENFPISFFFALWIHITVIGVIFVNLVSVVSPYSGALNGPVLLFAKIDALPESIRTVRLARSSRF